MQRYPDIRIDLGVADRPVDLISGNVDCVIRRRSAERFHFIARHLGDADMVIPRNAGLSEKARRSGLSARAAQRHKLISLSLPGHWATFPFRFRKGGEVQETAFRTISRR